MNHDPRIFLAGCGYTGERCADLFWSQGHGVTGLVSSQDSVRRLSGKPYPVIAADASRPAELASLFSALPPHRVLVHCLSARGGRTADAYRVTYVETLRHLIDALRPEFVVFTGSTSVYPQNDGSIVDETSPTGGTPTADVLLEAEKIALTAGGAVVRLGGIYGPGRARFLKSVLTGDTPENPDACINLIHRDDAAAALVHVALKRLDGIYITVDDCPARRFDLARALMPVVPEKVGTSDPVDRSSSNSATGKRVSNAKLRSTGWKPRYPSLADAWKTDADLRATVTQ